VLRDYHSPNLLWLGDRDGIAAVGLLDFQDAVMGPAAYDLASLLQDARIDVPEELEAALFALYVRGRREAQGTFDAEGFALLYATLAAQRATKILGIFARLDRRDGKPQYLRHLPRVFACLRRTLTHPGLAALDDWYRAHVARTTSQSRRRATKPDQHRASDDISGGHRQGAVRAGCRKNRP
jgi:N-acetylmuramate 1-kinase